MAFENLNLPDIDFSQPPELLITKYSFWSLKDDSLNEYRCLENSFDKNECLEIIKIGKVFDVQQSKTGDGRSFSDKRKSYNSWIPPSEISNWIYVKLQNFIEIANKHFQFDLHSLENLQFTEYSENYEGNYGPHIDKFPNPTSPNSHRKLSFSVQLTEPTMYEGGDLKIYDGNYILANKSIGAINFFPSYVLHEVTPVTKGTRYCLVGWVSGPKFK